MGYMGELSRHALGYTKEKIILLKKKKERQNDNKRGKEEKWEIERERVRAREHTGSETEQPGHKPAQTIWNASVVSCSLTHCTITLVLHKFFEVSSYTPIDCTQERG